MHEPDILHGDFYKICKEEIKDNSIDLIVTDPPYPKEFLHVWGQLAETAARVLKQGSYLATYSGQLYLDFVMSELGKHLEYCWIFSNRHKGQTQLVHARNVISCWKPVILFRKGNPGKFKETTPDEWDSIQRDKGLHEWQQSETGAEFCINHFSKPHDVVLDPFAGSGTTCVVAKRLDRKSIGIEIDEKYVNIIKDRIGYVQPRSFSHLFDLPEDVATKRKDGTRKPKKYNKKSKPAGLLEKYVRNEKDETWNKRQTI